MYRQHVPVIASAMRADPATFTRGCLFAILSMRQPFNVVPSQLEETDQLRADAPCLFGFKRKAYRHLVINERPLWEAACAIALDQPTDVILELLTVPGLGIVKSGFIAQMLGFDVACLDTRNVAREGRDRRAYRTDGLPPSRPSIQRKVAAYVADVQGHAERYWDEWCTEVGPIYGLTPEQASALHVDAICGDAIPF
ncbi:hypothetical protein UFOVP134_35 [uncultured Caudovirales phage]|uniref:Uncharacterized protein n=1 Tax=uncultured Caudovirales phage TaxID=2100421 RepID=A0A6J5LGR0_9CAUD|nr:hypothetical protein UFOVP134_35 [uncultured Caudovirales phage]